MKTRFNFALKLLTCTAFFFLLQQSAHAQNQGWFISAGLSQSSIDGDFNGTDALTGGTDIILIPSIDAGDGLSIFLGKQTKDGSASWNVGYSKSKHKADMLGFPYDVELQRYTLIEIHGYSGKSLFRPYLILNLNYERLVIENGSIDLTSGEVDDVTFYGGNLGLGLGLQKEITKMFSVSAQVSRQFGGYNRVKGIIDTERIKIDKISNSGWNIRLGLNLYFTS